MHIENRLERITAEIRFVLGFGCLVWVVVLGEVMATFGLLVSVSVRSISII